MMRAITLVGSLLTVPALAGPAEVCISCDNAKVVYRCSVEQSAKLEKYGLNDKLLPPVCAHVMAKLGGHERCQPVGAPDAPCNGIPKTIGISDLQKAAAGGNNDSVVPSLGDRAGSAAQSAGETIGGAFKKSWNCVTSLFQECG